MLKAVIVLLLVVAIAFAVPNEQKRASKFLHHATRWWGRQRNQEKVNKDDAEFLEFLNMAVKLDDESDQEESDMKISVAPRRPRCMCVRAPCDCEKYLQNFEADFEFLEVLKNYLVDKAAWVKNRLLPPPGSQKKVETAAPKTTEEKTQQVAPRTADEPSSDLKRCTCIVRPCTCPESLSDHGAADNLFVQYVKDALKGGKIPSLKKFIEKQNTDGKKKRNTRQKRILDAINL